MQHVISEGLLEQDEDDKGMGLLTQALQDEDQEQPSQLSPFRQSMVTVLERLGVLGDATDVEEEKESETEPTPTAASHEPVMIRKRPLEELKKHLAVALSGDLKDLVKRLSSYEDGEEDDSDSGFSLDRFELGSDVPKRSEDEDVSWPETQVPEERTEKEGEDKRRRQKQLESSHATGNANYWNIAIPMYHGVAKILNKDYSSSWEEASFTYPSPRGMMKVRCVIQPTDERHDEEDADHWWYSLHERIQRWKSQH